MFAPVDDDKREKREESNMRMDDMAIEWVEQVLSFLPLSDVYKCRSVCKTWQAAANYVISDWETLEVVVRKCKQWPVRTDKNQIFLITDSALCHRRRHRRGLAHVYSRNKKVLTYVQTWIERLNQLGRLREIRFVDDDFAFGTAARAVVNDIVLRNANTLTLMRGELLPLQASHRVVFSNLRDLEFNSLLDPDQAAACPRLVKLRAWTSVKVLQKLPAETMTSLHIDDLELESRSHQEIENLVSALSRLTRLKSIVLARGLRYSMGQWSEQHDEAYSKLFTNMKDLEEVDIKFPRNHALNVDVAMETLAENSPSVRSITMHNARMTDTGLRSLSRLTGLQLLDIGCPGRHSDITTEGILSLLRGGSRKVLRDLKLHILVLPDFGQIRSEGQLMQQKTGRSLSVGGDKFSYNMPHNFRIAIRGVLNRPSSCP